MWKVTARFNAVATGGKDYVIVEMTDLPEGVSADDLGPDGDGPRKYTLDDGTELSAEKDGTFIVPQTDEVLKAVSPSAPAGTGSAG